MEQPVLNQNGNNGNLVVAAIANAADAVKARPDLKEETSLSEPTAKEMLLQHQLKINSLELKVERLLSRESYLTRVLMDMVSVLKQRINLFQNFLVKSDADKSL